ncbi:MAG: glycosyltransferase family 4 protein [Candidatus Komeilibacteria bacterium]|nr:glycosyltransferase family 4 protein [Candidatus Komeilibacteria bacterium]
MKRTLLLTHEYYPFRGGIARYCYQLFRRLPTSQYVVLTDQKESVPAHPVIRKKLLSSYVRPSWLTGVRTLQKIVNEHKIEMIMTPNLLPLGSMVYALNKIKKIPYVISLHGLDINLALKNKRRAAISVLNGAAHCITNSETTASILAPLKLRTPVTILTPYFEEEKFSHADHAASPAAQRYAGSKLVITVGRLTRRKGQDMVIRAFPEVLRSVPNARYVIIGDGPDRSYFEGLIQNLKMQKYIEIRTNVADSELGGYYTAASLFAMPTRAIGADIEGFGIVFLEAAYFSLPIIAGRSGCEREALGGEPNALFVDGENLGALTESIIHLLVDAELAGFVGSHAKKHLETLPNWDMQARRLAQVLS